MLKIQGAKLAKMYQKKGFLKWYFGNDSKVFEPNIQLLPEEPKIPLLKDINTEKMLKLRLH